MAAAGNKTIRERDRSTRGCWPSTESAADAGGRVAGQYARETKNRYANRVVAALSVALVVLVVALVLLGFDWATVAVEAVVLAALVVLHRYASPIVDRWRREAESEEHVGTVIAAMRPLGWFALHDISTGRGNVEHVIVGPAGSSPLRPRVIAARSTPRTLTSGC
jgi:hypothetical protein